MTRGNFRSNVLLVTIVLGMISALGALRARADVLVYVTLNGLDPSTVTIFVGDAVYWTDGDGNGPYGIYDDGGAWNTVTDGNGILFMQTGSYGYYDDNGDNGTINVIAYSPPTLTITAPVNNATLSAPATFDFSADAFSPIGISDVEFYVGTNLVDDVYSEPFTTTVTNLPAGSYTLTAIAYDNDFDSVSAAISITVGGGAQTNILPMACADIYSSGVVLTNVALAMGSNVRGALEFAAFDATPYSSIMLALNPYALPMVSPNVGVYGFDGANGVLTGSNFNSGTLIGTLVFPSSVNFGQVITVDITRFVQSTTGPYFGLILQGVGDLSSTSVNYGTPPELIAVVSTLPPALHSKLVGNQMVIAWNTNNATGLSLQSTTDLTSGSWTPVTITPTPSGGQLVVTNPISGPRRFFRLSNH